MSAETGGRRTRGSSPNRTLLFRQLQTTRRGDRGTSADDSQQYELYAVRSTADANGFGQTTSGDV